MEERLRNMIVGYMGLSVLCSKGGLPVGFYLVLFYAVRNKT